MGDAVTKSSPTRSTQDMNLKVKALIVDDEKDICFLLTHILRQKNIQASQANTMLEAEQIIERESPPVIFLDNHLPDGLGISNIKKIKDKSPGCKIVMITAHDTALDRLKAREQGADYFIGKPFTKELIYNTLDKLCSTNC